ncbi:MAG TPA: tRNA (guanosine(46)-N7)-methyltransferase TrmB, partial [Campylobacterales bacterium]|nr:tRNA (guanosine(46)-N7)-methyltransferase TrmB [Campylobacterales bacterium]
MPNIQTKQLELIEFPATYNDYNYKYIGTSTRGEKLLFTTYKDKSFFLQIIQRDSDFLIKADKLTRISPVTITQNALDGFSKLHNLELTFSNIQSKPENNRLKDDLGILKNAYYFTKEFQYDKEIWIEIGFGSGRHLLHQANEHPDIQFIGLEIHRPSIEQVIKQCKLQKLENILISDFDARVFMQLINSNSVGKIFVHFPVPWDKKPHRRVISRSFIAESLRVLKTNGTLELRTDSEKYFAYSYETLQDFNKYDVQIRKNHNLPVSSKYEDRWKRQEKNIYDIILTNQEVSESNTITAFLTFEEYINFSEIKKRFSNHIIRGDDFFVHFEEIYEIDENSGIIKLSLGAYEKCEHKYLIFKDNKIQYFP